MLRILRKKGIAKKILWVLAVMLTVSFVFWGVASYLTDRQGPYRFAGKIFGREVSFREFAQSLQYAQNQAILRYGDNFQKVRQYLDLNMEAWDRLILLHEAKKRRVTVANDEVIKAIKNFSFFQRQGRFDKQLYSQIVQYVFQCSPSDFENSIRESLIFEKIYKQETLVVDVSDEDVRREYDLRNAKVQVDYILFPTANYHSNIQPTDDELKEFYDTHHNLFRLPAGMNVEYLTLEYSATISPQAQEALSQQADLLAQELASGQTDLHALGQKYQLPVLESGFLTTGEPKLELGWPLEVFQKAFQLKKGEWAGPLATTKGFYILRVKDTREERLLAFSEAKDKAIELFGVQRAQHNAAQKAQDVRQKFLETWSTTPGEKFETIAKKLGYKNEQTPEFTRTEYVPGVGPASQFHYAAFALTPEHPLSEIVELSSGYALLHLIKTIDSDDNKFQEDKDFLKERLLAQRKDQAFSIFLAQLRQKANLVDNIRKLADQGQP